MDSEYAASYFRPAHRMRLSAVTTAACMDWLRRQMRRAAHSLLDFLSSMWRGDGSIRIVQYFNPFEGLSTDVSVCVCGCDAKRRAVTVVEDRCE